MARRWVDDVGGCGEAVELGGGQRHGPRAYGDEVEGEGVGEGGRQSEVKGLEAAEEKGVIL